MPVRLSLTIVTLALLSLAGCQKSEPPPQKKLDYARELPPGEKALRKLSPAQYPDFTPAQHDPAALVRAIDQSLSYLAHPSSKGHFPYLDITHDRAVRTLQALKALATPPTPVDWNRAIADRFDVYQSVGAPAAGGAGFSGEVLFTGYFTPTYDASLVKTGPYQWPLYKKPADLVTDGTGEGVYRRLLSGTPPSTPPVAVPGQGAPAPVAADKYWTRAEIEANDHLHGQELVWLKTRWEAYVINVQGSGRLRLPDGKIYEVGYAGTNGHAYVSPGEKMVRDGVITKEQLSLAGLRAYFEKNPEQMDAYLWANPRMTFFTERPGGPFGSLNVAVTPGVTIATDKNVFPRAMPTFVVTRARDSLLMSRDSAGNTHYGKPGEVPFRKFMVDQDTGGAIRSAGRADLYMGVGAAAERAAGEQLFPGQLYYLAVKE